MAAAQNPTGNEYRHETITRPREQQAEHSSRSCGEQHFAHDRQRTTNGLCAQAIMTLSTHQLSWVGGTSNITLLPASVPQPGLRASASHACITQPKLVRLGLENTGWRKLIRPSSLHVGTTQQGRGQQKDKLCFRYAPEQARMHKNNHLFCETFGRRRRRASYMHVCTMCVPFV